MEFILPLASIAALPAMFCYGRAHMRRRISEAGQIDIDRVNDAAEQLHDTIEMLPASPEQRRAHAAATRLHRAAYGN